MLISHFASASGGRSPQAPYQDFPLDPTEGLPSARTPVPAARHVNRLHCKLLGTPMFHIDKSVAYPLYHR